MSERRLAPVSKGIPLLSVYIYRRVLPQNESTQIGASPRCKWPTSPIPKLHNQSRRKPTSARAKPIPSTYARAWLALEQTATDKSAAPAIVFDGVGSSLPSTTPSSSSTTVWFRYERYDCHPIATTPTRYTPSQPFPPPTSPKKSNPQNEKSNLPAKSARFLSPTNEKLNAVTAGQSLQELTQLTGTVRRTCSPVSRGVWPERRACMPKK